MSALWFAYWYGMLVLWLVIFAATPTGERVANRFVRLSFMRPFVATWNRLKGALPHACHPDYREKWKP